MLMKNLLLLSFMILKINGSRIIKKILVHFIWDTIISDTIQYHPVRLDINGNILP